MLDLKGNSITYYGHSTFSVRTPSRHDRSMGYDQPALSGSIEKVEPS
jgi:hypothetical protein